MHWADILIVLVMTLSTALLVFFEGWDVWQAAGVVVLGNFAIIGFLVGLMFANTKPEEYGELCRDLKKLTLSTLDKALKDLRLRKRS